MSGCTALQCTDFIGTELLHCGGWMGRLRCWHGEISTACALLLSPGQRLQKLTTLAMCPFAQQVFKICLEYWNFFVPDVYSSVCTIEPASQAAVAAVSCALLCCACCAGGRWVASRQRVHNRASFAGGGELGLCCAGYWWQVGGLWESFL